MNLGSRVKDMFELFGRSFSRIILLPAAMYMTNVYFPGVTKTQTLITERHGVNYKFHICFQERQRRTSLAVQWLRLCISNAGGIGLIPGQGTEISHIAYGCFPIAEFHQVCMTLKA